MLNEQQKFNKGKHENYRSILNGNMMRSTHDSALESER